MFIFWGRKLVYRPIGFVADFCPVCRGARAFALRRVGSASHVYYLSFGEGQLVGHEKTCQECGTALRAEPTAYASIAKSATNIDALTTLTFPSLGQVYAARFALEEKVRSAPESLSADERHALIRNAFLLVSPKVEKRFASTHIDRETGFALLAALVLVVVAPALSRVLMPDLTDATFLLALGIGLALVIWQGSLSGRRFMSRQVTPTLAKSLRPLRPTEAELRAVIAELVRLKHKLGRKLRLGDLEAALAEPAAVV